MMTGPAVKAAMTVCGQVGCDCEGSKRWGRGLAHCPTPACRMSRDVRPQLMVTVSSESGFVSLRCLKGCKQEAVEAAFAAAATRSNGTVPEPEPVKASAAPAPAQAAKVESASVRLRDQIPVELRRLPQWVGWRWVVRKGKRTKPPFMADGVRPASCDDESTWATFEEVCAAVDGGRLDGVGFQVKEGQELVGLDLDHCRDVASGDIEAGAQAVVDRFRSYTEVSPSGTGLRIFIKGVKPGPSCRKGNFEIYSRLRYFTVTGQRLTGAAADIEDRQAELAAYYLELFPEKPTNNGGAVRSGASATTEEVIALASRAKNGAKFEALMAGDLSGYGEDASAADAALCSLVAFYSRDPSVIDAVVRRSGLYREKWERVDYRERTIERALETVTETYSAPVGRTHVQKDVATSTGRPSTVDQPERVEEPAMRVGLDAAPEQDQERHLDRPGATAELPGLAQHAGDLTDLGNARRMVHRLKGELRFAPQLGVWLSWDGRRWAEDVTGDVERKAKDVVDGFLAEAQKAEVLERRRALADHWRRSQAAPRLAAMVEVATTEPRIPVTVDQLDRDAWALNVLNGVVNLKTGELLPHRPESLHTKLAPVAYDQDAPAPRWEQFLVEIFGGDLDLIGFVQRYAGYSLTGDVSEQVIAFLLGDGANGKTTLLSTLRGVVGDYGIQLDPTVLTVQTHEQHPTALTDLRGARFVSTIETEGGKRLAEALFKQLTGGDPIRARRMRQDFFEFWPSHKLWFAGNHLPRISGTDWGVWRRIALVRFEVTLALADQDRALPGKLAAERSGILAWMMRGCLEWQRTGLQIPGKVAAATASYRAAEDHVGRFLADRCLVGAAKSVTAKTMREAYEDWCQEQGEHPWTGKSLAQELTAKGFEASKQGIAGTRVWLGFSTAREIG